jgi:hypothetical protein
VTVSFDLRFGVSLGQAVAAVGGDVAAHSPRVR